MGNGEFDASNASPRGYPKRDMWGQIITRDGGVLGDGMAGRLLSPSKSTSADRDKLTEDLIKLELKLPPPSKTLRGVELTPGQYDEWSAMRGGVLRDVLSALHESPGVDAMPDFLKREMFARAINKVRTAATDAFLAGHPEISVMGMTERATATIEGRRREKVEQ